MRPVAHYAMGGIETDINGATRIKGVWAAGEAACVSLHGANRLGSNSTAECLVWGGITGGESAKYCREVDKVPDVPEDKVAAEQSRLYDDLLQREGAEDMYELRRELRSCMDNNVGVYRKGENLEKALGIVCDIKKRYANIHIKDKSKTYNTNLINALELGNLIDLAEIMVSGALSRQESRGAHARRDFPKRDDKKWLKHTLAFKDGDKPRFEYKPVNITTWKPVERKY